MTIAASSQAAPGAATLVVHAAGTGVAERTTSVALTIPQQAAFTITPSVTSLAVGSGATAQLSVGIARTNFGGPVTLALTGLPNGATATFSPNPAAGDASTVTISAGAAAPGSYTATIAATAAGLENRTASVSMTITPPVTAFSLTLCASDVPKWVGYDDGSGVWRQSIAAAGNAYPIQARGRGAVALVREVGTGSSTTQFTTSILYATADELRKVSASACFPRLTSADTAHGSVAGTGGQSASVAFGRFGASSRPDGAFTLSPDTGAHDLLGIWTSGATPGRMIIRRAVTIPVRSTIPLLDFGSSEAFDLLAPTITLSGATAGASAVVTRRFLSANGTVTTFASAPRVVTGSAFTYSGVPSTDAGDRHAVQVITLEPDGVSFRTIDSYFRTAIDRTLAIGPLLLRPTVSSAGAAPYPRPRVQLPAQSAYGAAASAAFFQDFTSPDPRDREVDVTVTAGYLGGVPGEWDLIVPDMSSASGFSADWMLASGHATIVTAGAYDAAFQGAATSDGTITRSASTQVTSTLYGGVGSARMTPARRSASRTAPPSAPPGLMPRTGMRQDRR
jgi:hypothetical protein